MHELRYNGLFFSIIARIFFFDLKKRKLSILPLWLFSCLNYWNFWKVRKNFELLSSDDVHYKIWQRVIHLTQIVHDLVNGHQKDVRMIVDGKKIIFLSCTHCFPHYLFAIWIATNKQIMKKSYFFPLYCGFFGFYNFYQMILKKSSDFLKLQFAVKTICDNVCSITIWRLKFLYGYTITQNVLGIIH